MLSQALGGVQLQVAEANVEAAAKILQQHVNGDFESYLQYEFDDIEVKTCPRCGSSDYSRSTSIFAKLLLILTFGLIDIIYKPGNNHHSCDECGFKWKG